MGQNGIYTGPDWKEVAGSAEGAIQQAVFPVLSEAIHRFS
jgi:hypothetical protein